MLAKAAYALYGELYSRLWQAGLVRPGGNHWHAERAGRHPRRSDRPIWLHAASLGEVHVARAYVDALKPLAPLYLTVQTDSGLQAAEAAMPDLPRAFAPLDLRRYASEFVSRVAPRALIVFETEIWPYWLLSFDGPVWFANARLSSRSFGRYLRIRGALQPSWKNVRGVFAQSARDRARFIALGLSEGCVHTAGQIKQFSMTVAPNSDLRAAWRRRLGVGRDERLWVAGSIRKDEIDTVLKLWTRARQSGNSARLVLALRHLRDVPAAMDRATQRNHHAARISMWDATEGALPPAIFVLDTHGDLGDLYAAADLVLLGGTFAPHGGHNPNEAARFGTPVITGPFTANIDGDLALLAKAGLSVRLLNLDDFPLLVESQLVPDPEAACRTLAAAVSTLPNPALELAAAVAKELHSA